VEATWNSRPSHLVLAIHIRGRVCIRVRSRVHRQVQVIRPALGSPGSPGRHAMKDSVPHDVEQAPAIAQVSHSQC
jgi:hypothetical protein